MSCTRRPAGTVLESGLRSKASSPSAWAKSHPRAQWPVTLTPPPSGSFEVCVFIKNLINVQITKLLTPQEAGVWGTGGGLSINSVLTLAVIPLGLAGGKRLSVIPV